MELINFIIGIDYKDSGPAVLDEKKVSFVSSILGEEPKDTLQSGIRLIHEKTKTIVVLEEVKIALGTEVGNVDDSKKRILEIIEKIYNDFDFQKKEITRIGVRTQWIKKWDSNFTDLLNRYRDVFYKDTSLLKEANDVAVHLTLADGDSKVNYISGPMKPEQGKMFVNFKDKDFPHDFMFLDIDKFVTKIPIKNELAYIKKYIEDSMSYGQKKAEETFDLLK